MFVEPQLSKYAFQICFTGNSSIKQMIAQTFGVPPLIDDAPTTTELFYHSCAYIPLYYKQEWLRNRYKH